MLAGESGLGKTTFINTLLSMGLKPYKDVSQRHQTPLQKTVEIEITKAVLEEKDFMTRVNVVDTPGFGDNVNNRDAWQSVVEFIDDQHESFMRQEQQPNRMNKVDMRVHACLYFIRPTGHSLKPLDVEAIRALSTRVNVIPVIAKADTLGPQEMSAFKDRIRQVLRAQNIHVFVPPNDSAATTANGIEEEAPVSRFNDELNSLPYSVIGSETEVTRANGTTGRGRVYPWGVVEVDNEEHCDFRKLHKLLIREHMLDLIVSTEEVHYEKYRAQQIEAKNAGSGARLNRSFENPKFKEEEAALRKSLTQQVKQEEARFKKWEANLIAERDRLNKDLEDAHVQLRELEVEYEALALKMKK